MVNTDENGIHYGTIYGNDVSSWMLDEIIQSGTNVSYENYINEMKEDFINTVQEWVNENDIPDDYIDYDQMFESIESSLSDRYESSDDTYLYTDDGYEVEFHTYDNSLIILKSPYVCYAAMCSPCFPNGGYITDKGSVLSYCLGIDWYDEDYPCQNEPIEIEKVV